MESTGSLWIKNNYFAAHSDAFPSRSVAIVENLPGLAAALPTSGVSIGSKSLLGINKLKGGLQRISDSIAQLIKPVGLSNKGIKHASRHLPEFQALDKSYTLNKLLRLGQRIARNEKNLVNTKNYGSKAYQAKVRVGEKDVSVKSVVNASGNLRSVHIVE